MHVRGTLSPDVVKPALSMHARTNACIHACAFMHAHTNTHINTHISIHTNIDWEIIVRIVYKKMQTIKESMTERPNA